MKNKLRVGITGQFGFIGMHLYHYLGLQKGVDRILFLDDFFQDESALKKFVRQCDVIVHLAALNRHQNAQVLYDTNVNLVKQLISAMEAEKVKPHVIFSSSIQEFSDNLYGVSKLEGRRLFDVWAKRVGAQFTGMIIPNVFGPFGRPNYNSVIATFCHKLTHGEVPEIIVDEKVKLLYINDLCKEVINIIKNEATQSACLVNHNAELSVSEILKLLNYYKNVYFDKQVFPRTNSYFEQCLFNTFVSYIKHQEFFPKFLNPQKDDRGVFFETIKLDETGGQVSFSTTKPGITRGNHYHTRKIERFAVIKGSAKIQLRRIGTKEIMNFELLGEKPAFVDIPIWYTHSVTNTGNDDLYIIFWINESYNHEDPDTYYEKV